MGGFRLLYYRHLRCEADIVRAQYTQLLTYEAVFILALDYTDVCLSTKNELSGGICGSDKLCLVCSV